MDSRVRRLRMGLAKVLRDLAKKLDPFKTHKPDELMVTVVLDAKDFIEGLDDIRARIRELDFSEEIAERVNLDQYTHKATAKELMEEKK